MTSLTSDRLWPLLRTAVCTADRDLPDCADGHRRHRLVQLGAVPDVSAAGLSLQWYRKLFSLPAWIDAMSTSVKVMVPSAIIATAAGTAAAVGLARGRIPGARVIASLMMAPMVVPVIITAAAMLGVFRGWGLQGTLLGLILAHADARRSLCGVHRACGAAAGRRSARERGLDARRDALAAPSGASPFR